MCECVCVWGSLSSDSSIVAKIVFAEDDFLTNLFLTEKKNLLHRYDTFLWLLKSGGGHFC